MTPNCGRTREFWFSNIVSQPGREGKGFEKSMGDKNSTRKGVFTSGQKRTEHILTCESTSFRPPEKQETCRGKQSLQKCQSNSLIRSISFFPPPTKTPRPVSPTSHQSSHCCHRFSASLSNIRYGCWAAPKASARLQRRDNAKRTETRSDIRMWTMMYLSK